MTVSGLEQEPEKYDLYSAMICQETDVTGDDFFSAFGKKFSISYNEATNSWEGKSLAVVSPTQTYSGFDKQGQYYVYIAARESGSTHWEILDGPTAIETPAFFSVARASTFSSAISVASLASIPVWT